MNARALGRIHLVLMNFVVLIGLTLGTTQMQRKQLVLSKRKAGRPATGRDPIIAWRVTAEAVHPIDKWGGERVSRSEAIRTLIEIGLASKRKR